MLEFGGTVWVGVIEAGSNDHAIKISIYFGIDFNKPDENYIFGSVNKFTLSQIFKAFKLGKPKVPRVVAESGFPEGLTVSYSMKGEFILMALVFATSTFTSCCRRFLLSCWVCTWLENRNFPSLSNFF